MPTEVLDYLRTAQNLSMSKRVLRGSLQQAALVAHG